MSRASRIELYKKIEAHRKRPLIVYVTSKREGAAGLMSTDALPHIIEQLDALPLETKELDFLIASYGGDPMVAWRIISLVRQRVEKVSVLVPQSAYSAATLLALGCNEIVIHPNGHLGPVDMQITTTNDAGKPKRFSTEEISSFLDFVRDNLKITDQEHIRVLFELICKEVGSLVIGFTARSSKLAVDLGERLLALHLKDDDSRSKLRSLVENMSRRFQSHAYPVNRAEAKELGLPVSDPRDKTLEDLMWAVWLNIEEELQEQIPFVPVHELLKSTEASKLLAPVPQLTLPVNAGTPGNFQASVPDITHAASVTIQPIDFECKIALVESSRKTHTLVCRGKILSCRLPNLMIHFNAITTFRGWEKQN